MQIGFFFRSGKLEYIQTSYFSQKASSFLFIPFKLDINLNYSHNVVKYRPQVIFYYCKVRLRIESQISSCVLVLVFVRIHSTP